MKEGLERMRYTSIILILIATCAAWGQPSGMVVIPGGDFEMGNSFNADEGDPDELPRHLVHVDSIYMDRYLVTNQQYAAGLNWALANGHVYVSAGVVYGTGNNWFYCDTTTSSSYSRITWDTSTFGVLTGEENHPMVMVSWFGAAAYANWRSEMEGRALSYTFNGSDPNWACDFLSSGYQLPTEAEWEHAARGGIPALRFPWSSTETIQHARANYYSSSLYPYDTSPTRGYHPTFNDGVFPYTSPVEYFPPNGYGLFDMAGNAGQWCNDWYEAAYYGTDTYPTPPLGPLTGTTRTKRSGSWANNPHSLRCANRASAVPYYRDHSSGFRLVLRRTDCNGNQIWDFDDIANCDGSSWCSDCNGNGLPDECDLANQGTRFGDVNSWTAFDAGSHGVGFDPDGYRGAAFDGRYVYFAPSNNGTAQHGEVLRYDTTENFANVSSWATYDPHLHGVGEEGRGYDGALFDGRFVYFVPKFDGVDYHGEVLRYDTMHEFSSASSWSAFDAGDHGIGVDPDGYIGAVFDGRYVYFVPNYNGTERHGEVLRLDTTGDFESASSWAAFDAGANGVGTDPDGYNGGIYDGRYVYFAPGNNGTNRHGEVLRLDTTGDFLSTAAWSTFDASADGVGVNPQGYGGGVFDGRYVYFAPSNNGVEYHGEVLRYDTYGGFEDPSAWTSFDPATEGVGTDPRGFAGAVFDGQFIYFVPFRNDGGEVLRFDTEQSFSALASWDSFDAQTSGVGVHLSGYWYGVFDGRYVYFVPREDAGGPHGEVLRYDTRDAVATDCNGNEVPDECDITEGTSTDFNGNGVPDECEGVVLGLYGTVVDGVSGSRVAGAEVSLPSYGSVFSGAQGQFGFGDVDPGLYTLSVSKNGYYPAARDVEVAGDSSTLVTVLMTPATDFGVVDVRGRFSGPYREAYYLDGVSLTESFTATVDWQGHAPGSVRWITPFWQSDDPCPTDSIARSFDMGSDFGEHGRLTVVAVSGDEPPVVSAPYVANFEVVPIPMGVPHILIPSPLGQTLKYTTPTLRPGDVKIETGGGVEDGAIPQEIPLFGGKAFKFISVMDASAEVSGNGEARTTVALHPPDGINLKKTELCGMSLVPEVSGNLLWRYDGEVWDPGGNVQMGMYVTAKVPRVPYYFPIGPCPVCVPCYFRGRITIGASQGLEVVGWADVGEPWFYGTPTLDPFPYAEANLGAGVADVLAVEGYLGGGAKMRLQYPLFEPMELEYLKIYLSGGIRLVALIFVHEIPVATCTYDFTTGEGGCNWGDEKRGEQSRLALYPRDYLHRDKHGYAVFAANESWRSKSRDAVTEEVPIELNVFGQSTPHLVANGNDLILAWVYDDPARTPTNRTEIVFSGYDSVGETWSAPAPIVDDDTADFHPQLAMLPSGNTLVAWENVSEVLIEPGDFGDPCIDECLGDPDPGQCQVECKLEEMKSKTEIAIAAYDALSGTWSTQTVITSNGILDRSPRVATAADGTAMLTWISNAANHEIGDPNNPNTIHFVTYDGATWSTTSDVATNVLSIIKSTMAYNGGGAILLFIGDTDADPQTPDDRELFGIQFDGVAWGPVTQLTDDSSAPIEDGNPQVAYDAYGDPVIVWYRDGDLYSASDFLLSDASVAVDLEGASTGAADFRLAAAASGQVALVWQGASDDVVDMWYALYMPGVSSWTKPRRLTEDSAMEHAFAPVFNADGALLAAYNKVQTVYETREVVVGGEIVVIDNVPVPDQSDLYLLEHTISGDLGLAAKDIWIVPANPLPGTEATITAIVHNLGDTPAENIDVAFYDGDPAGGGTLIDIPILAGPLVGGAEAEISATWLVPPSTQPRGIYVVIDPSGVQEDRDPLNNVATIEVLAPDLTVSEIVVQAAGPHRFITARVANEGALTATDVGLVLRRDAADGEVLTTLAMTGSIIAGAYHDASWTWEDAAPFPDGSVEVFAIVDEAGQIDEIDEDNNVGSVIVSNVDPVFDCNLNGMADAYDIVAGTSLDCQANGVPDECDITAGAVDGNTNGVPDECEFQPDADVAGCRYLVLTPIADADPIALLVTGDAGDPNVSCVSQYVQADGSLDVAPVFQTPAAWGSVHVTDEEIIPNATFEIQGDLGVPGSPLLTLATNAHTRAWGDLNDDGTVNGHDLFIFIETYLGHLPYWGADLCAGGSSPGTPDGQVDGDDLLCWIDAYYGESYPFATCQSGRHRSDSHEIARADLPAARLSLVPRQRLVKPGQAVLVDVFIEGAQDLRLYQVAVDARGGNSGEFVPQNVSVDTTREDYVFARASPVIIPDTARRRALSALWDGSVSPSGRRYLATFEFVPSRDAGGVFRLTLQAEPNTMLRDSRRQAIVMTRGSEATVTVLSKQAIRFRDGDRR